MILYLIRCGYGLDNLKRQLDTLYHPDNIYLVSIPHGIDVASVQLPAKYASRVHFMPAGPTTWGTESGLLVMMEGMKEALRLSRSWRYIALLSDSCISHRRQTDLFDFLQDRRAEGVTEFFVSYPPPPVQFFPELKYTGVFESILGTRPGVNLRTDVALRAFFASNATSPIMRLDLRPAFHVSEPENGVILCRPLHAIELAERRSCLARWPPRFGRFFSVFSRATCAWLTESEEAILFLQLCRNFFFPDECYFATVLRRPGCGIEQGSICNGNLHFRNAGNAVLVDEEIDAIRGSNSFFARKFVSAHAPALTSYLAELNN